MLLYIQIRTKDNKIPKEKNYENKNYCNYKKS